MEHHRKYELTKLVESQLLTALRNSKLKKSIKIFQKLKSYKRSLLASTKKQEFSIDFEDAGGLTPLHYACQNNQLQCIELLLFENGASLGISCAPGFRPKDLIHNPNVKESIKKYFKRIDRAIEKIGEREAPGTLRLKYISSSIRMWQAQRTKDEESLELSDELEN